MWFGVESNNIVTISWQCQDTTNIIMMKVMHNYLENTQPHATKASHNNAINILNNHLNPNLLALKHTTSNYWRRFLTIPNPWNVKQLIKLFTQTHTHTLTHSQETQFSEWATWTQQTLAATSKDRASHTHEQHGKTHFSTRKSPSWAVKLQYRASARIGWRFYCDLGPTEPPRIRVFFAYNGE